jgi:hypothetical protein
MPARDGTGPRGQGVRTGRGMGNCRPGAQIARGDIKRVWWNPLHWFGGVFRSGNSYGRGVRRGTGRGSRGRL